jgi:hypothetical protein
MKITNEQSNTTQGTYAMSEHHYHAAVWIDHHEARVFHFSAADVERLVCTRTIRPGTSITRQILSGAVTLPRIKPIFTPPRNQLQTLVQS